MTSRQEARQEIQDALNDIVREQYEIALAESSERLRIALLTPCECSACRCPHCGLPTDNPFCCDDYDAWEFDPFED